MVVNGVELRGSWGNGRRSTFMTMDESPVAESRSSLSVSLKRRKRT
jgi:hypothetical protein